MRHAMVAPGRKVISALLIFLLLVLAARGIDAALRSVSFAEELLKSDINAMQKEQLGIYVRQTEQLLTLSTIILGAVGGVLFGTPKNLTAVLKKNMPITLCIGALSLGLSIYLGYLSYDGMVWMLSKKFFNLDTPVLSWLRTGQFLTFLFGIANLVVFAYQVGRA
jgi:hypothetical protein